MTCLPRALALQRMLAQRGIPVRAPDRSAQGPGAFARSGDLAAHAWVEVEGRAVGEPEAIEERFRPLLPAFMAPLDRRRPTPRLQAPWRNAARAPPSPRSSGSPGWTKRGTAQRRDGRSRRRRMPRARRHPAPGARGGRHRSRLFARAISARASRSRSRDSTATPSEQRNSARVVEIVESGNL